MHATPPGPLRFEMEMAAHKERPWGKDCIQGKGQPEGQHCERRHFEQQVAAFTRGRWSARKITGLLYWGFDK